MNRMAKAGVMALACFNFQARADDGAPNKPAPAPGSAPPPSGAPVHRIPGSDVPLPPLPEKFTLPPLPPLPKAEPAAAKGGRAVQAPVPAETVKDIEIEAPAPLFDGVRLLASGRFQEGNTPLDAWRLGAAHRAFALSAGGKGTEIERLDTHLGFTSEDTGLSAAARFGMKFDQTQHTAIPAGSFRVGFQQDGFAASLGGSLDDQGRGSVGVGVSGKRTRLEVITPVDDVRRAALKFQYDTDRGPVKVSVSTPTPAEGPRVEATAEISLGGRPRGRR